ncbi:MAG: hypothetical protein R2826_08080 [Thermoleophilia bacterium]
MRTLRGFGLALWFSAALLALFAGHAYADESVPVTDYEVNETFTIAVNDVGDAHYTDVLVYDPDFFETAGLDLETYPQLLSRRYERQAAIRELQNFNATIERETGTVKLTFDEPGYAYNLGDHWWLPFFTQAPTSTDGAAQVFEEDVLVNNEFTLWQDADFKVITRLELPAGASNVSWDENDEAMLYQLTYAAPATGNVLQRNSTVFAIVFGLLMAASAVIAVLLLVRGRGATDATPPA